MPELRCKSVRVDGIYTIADFNEIWSWAPERDIKIKAVSWSIDIPFEIGTVWHWLSKGLVGMVAPAAPNEEEMIISAIHARSEIHGIEPANVVMYADFGNDYMEVEYGEKLYLVVRGPTGKSSGISLCIYYLK